MEAKHVLYLANLLAKAKKPWMNLLKETSHADISTIQMAVDKVSQLHEVESALLKAIDTRSLPKSADLESPPTPPEGYSLKPAFILCDKNGHHWAALFTRDRAWEVRDLGELCGEVNETRLSLH